MAIKKYYDSDCNLGVLDGKTSSASAARATHIPRTSLRAASMSSSVCARVLLTGKRLLSSLQLIPTSRSWRSRRLPRPATSS